MIDHIRSTPYQFSDPGASVEVTPYIQSVHTTSTSFCAVNLASIDGFVRTLQLPCRLLSVRQKALGPFMSSSGTFLSLRCGAKFVSPFFFPPFHHALVIHDVRSEAGTVDKAETQWTQGL